jgi:hypothetical protein
MNNLTVIAVLVGITSQPMGYLPRLFAPENLPSLISLLGIIVAILTLCAIHRQARIAKETLVATFRPQMIVRKVSLRAGTKIPTMGIPDAHPWMVRYTIANVGGSRATLQSRSFEVCAFENGLPADLPYRTPEFADPISIQSGEEKDFAVAIGESLTGYFRILGTKGPYLSQQKVGHVYFWGRAQYCDDRGVIRALGICRHYKTDTGKFVPVSDPDYEYED